MSIESGNTERPRVHAGHGRVRAASAPDFDRAYRIMTPDWDIGRPQRAFLDLARRGEIHGKVLDVGCGTGEHALMAAAMGLDAVGIDISPAAIDIATGKARDRGLPARFVVLDSLRMGELGEQFDTALDCGMFHVLGDEDRPVFAESLRAVLRPGGRYFMICFRGRESGCRGTARMIRLDEIKATFGRPGLGFCINSVEQARQENTRRPKDDDAWLVKITLPGGASS